MTLSTMPAREFYTLPEVADALRMTVDNLRKLVRNKRIAVHQDRPGAKVLIHRSDLEGYVNRMRVEVEPEKERGKG
ncbi:MAG: hypothetical protein AUJ49_04935 [Desulfovibrionaceae bacterium CG1_02_65_16]|nr:MAG: hypothetical protein AUJ49_04935 [Desulfovibrionaceae bacterium CG1_02_65_16]